MIRVNSIVRRKDDHEKHYQVLWFIAADGSHSESQEGCVTVRLCPADADAKEAGARRTAVAIKTFWNTFEALTDE